MQFSGGLIQPFRVLPEVLLDDSAVALAGIDFDPSGNRLIPIRFTTEGARRFGQITATNINRQLAIVFHGRIISAPVIRGPISGGECTISGGAIGAGESYEIVDALNHAPKPSIQMWEFSPPRQCALLLLNLADGMQGWADLDSGLLITNKSTDWRDRAGHDWIHTNGLDLVVSRSAADRPVFYGFDLVVQPTPTNGWNTLTAADVAHNWKLLTRLPQQNPHFSASPGNGDTFFFQTRKGGKGILQILGNTDDNRAAQFRYKLVQPAGTDAGQK